MKQKIKSLRSLPFLTAVLAAFLFGLTLTGGNLSVSSDSKAGNTSTLFTDDILAMAGVSLSTADEVIRVDTEGAVSLTVVRAFDVRVLYRGEEFTVKCTGKTVADAIAAAGITLSGAETVTPSLDTAVGPNAVIEITADSYVSLAADGEVQEIATKAKTVEEFLKEQSVKLSENDILNVKKSDSIYDGMKLVIMRVEYKEEKETQYIDYGFITEETDEMYLGVTAVERYGVEGEKEVTYKCKYVDGKLVDRVLLKEEVLSQPVDQLELVGTYVEPEYQEPEYEYDSDYAPSTQGGGSFTDHNGNTVSYKSVLTGSATAYYAAEGAYTATGVPVYKGGVAVNPDIIPYGTSLYIVSSDGSVVYGYATAVDTGGALMSGEALVDVFYPTYDECVSWGRRNVTVYILA